jgi:hypothetical protein
MTCALALDSGDLATQGPHFLPPRATEAQVASHLFIGMTAHKLQGAPTATQWVTFPWVNEKPKPQRNGLPDPKTGVCVFGFSIQLAKNST